MPNIQHSNFTGAGAVHPAAFSQSTDPGAVGANKFWVDTTTGPPFQLKKRNAANTAWETVGVSTALTDPTTTRGDIIRRGASALERLGVGATNTLLHSNGTDPAWSATPTVSGELTAADLKPSGLTGATAATRYVGATTGGAPTSGTFAIGDFIIDHGGKVWICTTAGTPGTWTQSSGNMTNPMTANQDIIVGGTSGAPARVGVGANGQVLTVSAGAVSWQNSAAGFSNPMTQPGDMIYGITAGAPARLAVGANGQVLKVVGGLPGWGNEAGGVSSNTEAAALFLSRNFR